MILAKTNSNRLTGLQIKVTLHFERIIPNLQLTLKTFIWAICGSIIFFSCFKVGNLIVYFWSRNAQVTSQKTTIENKLFSMCIIHKSRPFLFIKGYRCESEIQIIFKQFRLSNFVCFLKHNSLSLLVPWKKNSQSWKL